MKRRKRRIMAILLAFAMVFTMVNPSMFGGVITAQAEESTTSLANVTSGWVDGTNTYNILSEGDLLAVSMACNAESGYERYLSANYVLYAPLNFKEEHHNKINIGSSSRHFTGTFDGQGYTITGLWGDAQTAVNNGLFGVMEGATVKNLVIENADYRSNQYGGILAAQAKNSVIQNVTIIDSKCKVASLGAVVGLITTGGLYGGALVGYADNTKIYNCESRNTSVYVDTTGGVQALGGDGMYMGGLVGWMDNGSILEYSRVVGGEVSTEYYVAVGALAANNLYAGGLVGRIDGSDETTTQVLDCFSSASVNYDGECYVSVGAGLSGYAGGIAARISGTNYTMERCHYAGNIHGHLLNSILVLPVIAMEDYYLGGVAGSVEDLDGIKNCYFNWDKATVGNEYPGGPKVPAIWGKSNNANANAIGDAQYNNPTFFVGFDFDGTDKENLRDTNNNELLGGLHYNKWVIDPANNMPVHGSSVQAEIDFPGAGTISFDATSIQKEQTTNGWSKEEKPDDELANGATITQIAQTHAEMNEELTLTATVKKGYNFKGWYLKGSESSKPISTEFALTLGGTTESSYQYKDGDVFVAKYTANVTFEDTDYSTEEYTYQQMLDLSEKIPSLTGYLFLGWVKEPIPEELDKNHLTPDNIDSFEYMEEFTSVTECLTLYPVFISVANSNVSVQMESWELVTENNDDKKFGQEGEAKILTDQNGDIYITVEEKDNVKNTEEYRFAGWYDITDDPNGELVSQSKTYYLTNVDLSQKRTYEARYQYSVSVYLPVKTGESVLRYEIEGSHYGDFYVGYGVDVNPENVTSGPISIPIFNPDQVEFQFWTTEDKIQSSYSMQDMNWLADDKYGSGANQKIEINGPKKIYAAVTLKKMWSVVDYHPFSIQSDFPEGIEKIEVVSSSSKSITVSATIKDGYQFNGFWEYKRDGGDWELQGNSINDGSLTTSSDGKTFTWTSTDGYGFYEREILIRLAADIKMYSLDKDDASKTNFEPLKRKYNSVLFNNIDGEFHSTENWDELGNDHLQKVTYEVSNVSYPVGEGTTLNDTDMYREKEEYTFLGWIELTEESEAALFSDSSKPFVTDKIDRVETYKLPENFRITETMDICPVYGEYNVDVNTTFGDATPESPYKPVVSKEITNDGTLTLKPDNKEGYSVIGWIVKVGGEETNLQPIVNDKGNYILSNIKTNVKYEITAIYTADVSFKHADGENVSKDIPYESGEPVGEVINELVPQKNVNSEESTINVDGSSQGTTSKVFVGWNAYKVTTDEINPDSIEYPSDKFTGFADKNTLINEVTDMIPVYTVPDITLNSNMETAPAKITISKTGVVTLDASLDDSEELKGYVFTGWVENIDGKEEIVSTEPSYIVPPEDLREKHTYIACYDVVITYKIPVVEDGAVVQNEYTNITDTISCGEKLNSNYNMQAMTAAKEAFDKTTDKAFTGKWSAFPSETLVYTGEDEITEPFNLYPVSTKAVTITYKVPKADGNGQIVIDENGKSSNGYDDFTTNIPVGFALKDGYDDEAKLRVETRMSKSEYMFTGNWTGKEGSETVYDRTAAITSDITLYPILKQTVTITYKIPSANEDTGKAVINNGTSDEYDDVQVRIPVGEIISDTYDKEASIKVAEVLEDTGWVFTGDWTKTAGSEDVYKEAVNKNETLYPILKHGDYIPVYSNMSDTVYSVGMVADGNSLILPKETVLLTTTTFSTRGATGIDGRTVISQFIGYSLVKIENETRTTEGLYKAATSIDKATVQKYIDDTTGEKYRIYAVWAQIQNMSEASIYVNQDGSQQGLFTAASVNTKILKNAGLQNGIECEYDRRILYSRNSKSITVTTDRDDWNNTLYQQYFDKDYIKNENWDVYVSFLYNIGRNTDEYGVCPYLSFTYTNPKSTGNLRDKYYPTAKYTLQTVANKLLEKTDKDSYLWKNYMDIINEYADIT